MQFEDVQKVVDTYMLLGDRRIVKLLCAVVIANRINRYKPTWLFLVSNSSGGKSMLLEALAYASGMKEVDNMTAKTLISGARGAAGVETSLLFRLPDHPILLMKDLTSFLGKRKEDMSEIFSQLRLIYDGSLSNSYGTGDDIVAKVKVGLIAGVTSAIEDIQSEQATMGQRAIHYYMSQPDRLESTRMALQDEDEDAEDQNIAKDKMGMAFKEYLDDFPIPDKLPKLSEEVKENIVALSEMATRGRSGIKHAEFSRDKVIVRKELLEMPIRLARQLKSVAKALMLMNGGTLSPLDESIIYGVALDSIPFTRKKIMMAATRFESATLDGLASEVGMPNESVRFHLDDLVAHDVIYKAGGIGNKFTYVLKPSYRKMMSQFENIQMTDEILDHDEELPTPAEPPENKFDTTAFKDAGLI